jgi:hypothetical protein
LTADPTMQVERNLDFVTERVEEMKGLADQGEAIPVEVVVRMEAQMDLAVGYTMVAPEDKAPELVKELGRRMIRQQQVLERIKAEGTQKEEGGALALESALELAKRVAVAAELSEGDPLRMQNEYQMLAEPEEPTEPAEPQGQDNEGMGVPEMTPEAEGLQNRFRVAVASGPDEESSSTEPDSPGKRNNNPNVWGLDEPVEPAGSSDMAASSGGSGAGASNAKAAKAGKTATASVEAPNGKGR